MKINRTAICATALLGLAACGGGGTSSQEAAGQLRAAAPELDTRYATLRSDTREDSDVIAFGVADGTESVALTGTYDHRSQTLEVDGQAARIVGDIPGRYQYTSAFTQSAGSRNITGVAGLATSTADMPNSGNVTYRGGATGIVNTGTGGASLEDGSSTVEARFADGRVNATLTDFQAFDQVDGTPASAPIDTITIRDMRITDNRFAGGTLRTSLRGDAIDITGSNTQLEAGGAFFGLRANGVPHEVGGVAYAEGGDGIVAGTFIAD